MEENGQYCETCKRPLPPKRRHINERAETAISDLRAEGIEPTPDEIVWLDTVCRAFDDPPGGNFLPGGTPVKVGPDIWLWPFTVSSSRWYSIVGEWFAGDDDAWQLWVLAYALANGKRPLHATTYAETRRVVDEWVNGITVDRRQLRKALERVQSDIETSDYEQGNPSKTGDGATEEDIVQMLVAQVGGTPDMWTTDVTLSYAVGQLRKVNAVRAAENGEPLYATDPEIRATRELGWAMICIRRRAKENG